jgi:hypothetical protein
MSHDPLLPRGNALTEVMEFTARDGGQWVAYIEGFPAVRTRRLFPRTVLPGRRLRFDSATESRVSGEVPAGSPFLSERRLLALLAASSVLPPVEAAPAAPSRVSRWRTARHAASRQGQAAWSRGRRLAADAMESVYLAVDAILHGHRVRS